MVKNAILIDMKEPENWEFKRRINENTKENWETISFISNTSQRGVFRKFFSIYTKYFYFPFRIFLKRKYYNKILAWQQFYGIVLAFYCRLFRVKKAPQIYILSLIYQPKRNIIGAIYYNFVKFSLEAKCVKKVIIESSVEFDKYLELFNIKDKLVVCIEGYEKKMNFSSTKGDYFLSVGRTNRDYNFLIDSFNGRNEKLIIITDQNIKKKYTKNIKILNNVYGLDYEKILSKCYAVVLCMGNAKVSSGQLVILNAMRYGKPIIINNDECIYEYVKNGENGIYFEKTPSSLFDAIKIISNNNKYDEISIREKNIFLQEYTFEKFGDRISEFLD